MNGDCRASSWVASERARPPVAPRVLVAGGDPRVTHQMPKADGVAKLVKSPANETLNLTHSLETPRPARARRSATSRACVAETNVFGTTPSWCSRPTSQSDTGAASPVVLEDGGVLGWRHLRVLACARYSGEAPHGLLQRHLDWSFFHVVLVCLALPPRRAVLLLRLNLIRRHPAVGWADVKRRTCPGWPGSPPPKKFRLGPPRPLTRNLWIWTWRIQRMP